MIFTYTLILIIFLYFLYKIVIKYNLALDNDFNKPQAIHSFSCPRILGIPTFVILFFAIIFNFFEHDYFLILLFSILCSLIGLLDDFGLKIRPILRFITQIIIVLSIFFYSDSMITIDKLDFLPAFFENDTFLFFFTIFAILTIANSFNFMDGCNGLIVTYSILVFFILYLSSNDESLELFCISIIIFLAIVLFLNFPYAKAYLGDFGAYFLGFISSFLIIYLSNNKSLIHFEVNEWFFATLLLYPSFEIFTTVTRRLLHGQSPFYPDNLHLHSLIYRLLVIKFDKKFSNYFTTILLFLLNLFIFSILLNTLIDYYYLNYLLGFILLIFLRSLLKRKLFKLELQK